MKIDIISDNNLIIPEYVINFMNKSKKTLELVENYELLKNLDQTNPFNNIIELNKKEIQKKKYKKKKNFIKKLNNTFTR